MGRRNGEGQYRSIGNIFFQGSAILMMIAAAVTLLSYTVSPVLLRNILSSPAIYGATMDYINLRIWGLFFSLIACMFRAFYMATTRTSILTLNGIVMVLSNVVLNYIFVFGKLGLPAMGIARLPRSLSPSSSSYSIPASGRTTNATACSVSRASRR